MPNLHPAYQKKGLPSSSSASATARSEQPPSRKRKMDANETKYYAVRAGHKPGVYTSWAICQQQISGFKGAQFKSFLRFDEASAFADGRDPPSGSSSSSSKKPDRFYGVAVGLRPGVYTDWGKAQEAIGVGTKGPKYKKFDTRQEAEAFVKTYGKPQTSTNIFAPIEVTSDEEEQQPPAKKPKTTNKPEPKTGGSKGGGDVEVIYTDGSSLGNGKLGAVAGVGVYFGENDPRNISERLKGEVQTNQRAELTAILRALEVVNQSKAIEIRSDSKYSIQCVTEWYVNWERNGWKTRDGPVKNKDLVQAIREKLNEREKKGTQTKFVWVKGHASDAGNVAADYLAVEGAKKK